MLFNKKEIRKNLVVCLVILLIACSNSKTNKEGDSVQYDIPLQLLVNNVDIKSNQTTQIKFTYDFPFYTPAFTEFSVNLDETLNDIKIELPTSSGKPNQKSLNSRATEQVEMYAYISSASESASTCVSGEKYGPFTISVENNNQPSSVSPAKATATKPTLSIVNAGSFSVCLEVVSPIAAKADLDGVSINATSCNQSPDDIDGIWTGTYSCTNQGTSNDGGDISLRITQNGYSASYTDGEATYKGTVCGNVFEYDGGVEGAYKETGTFTLKSNGSALKTSSWKSTIDESSGDCTDNLVKSGS